LKLLLDEHLPASLKRRLRDVLPDITHVGEAELIHVEDAEIWEFAQAHELTIVTKDEDYWQLSLLRGYPPKVIWLRLGNCSVHELESCFRVNLERIEAFHRDETASLLMLHSLPQR
jgi:predicted nuclease of predicted toxin-antitoxin system